MIIHIANYGNKMKNKKSRKKSGQMASHRRQKISGKIFSSPGQKSRKKSGQMKIQQMAFMLIAVMIFFALVGLLIIMVKFSGLKGQASDLAQKNAMLLVSKVANSPELSCGNAFGESRISCIDFDKAMILKNNIEKYKGFWGISKMEIIKISPRTPGNADECKSQNYPNCNKITLINGQGFSSENFVVLCRREFDEKRNYDKCELAKIIIGYEKVQ